MILFSHEISEHTIAIVCGLFWIGAGLLWWILTKWNKDK